MPPELLSKYFTRLDDAYQVSKRVRNLTVFGEYDLGQRAPFPRIDLVLCRNVLIYFTKELQQRTLQLFAFSLRLGGFLVLGKSETTSPLPQYFAMVNPALKVFRRQGDRLLIPAPAVVEGGSLSDRPAARRISVRSPVPGRRPPGELPAPRWSLVDRLGSFLFESPIGIVVVDRNYDILTVNQAARTLLGIHGQGVGDDLIHLAQVPSGELKAALDGAFRSESRAAERELEVHDAALGETRYLQISAYPDPTGVKESRVENVFVLVVDVTQSSMRRREMERENQASSQSLERFTAQNAELLERQRTLIEANNELTSVNADLRSANEHLLIAAEEAEASAEEVETLNEEMQATSEELETLNEELQATVEELNTTNEELAARSGELELLAKQRQERLEEAQAALATLRAVVDQVPVPICLIDAKSKVALASQQYVQLAESDGRVPRVGDAWRNPPKTIEVNDNGRGRLAYTVRPVQLPHNGTDVMLILERRP
jgi:two-component system CheB/CheR fusion protein